MKNLPSKKGVVAAVCRGCGRELRRNTQDNNEDAFKRAKWGQNRGGSPISGVCRSCRKHGKA